MSSKTTSVSWAASSFILNLWDRGSQDAFLDSYLSTQRSTIFQNVRDSVC